MYPVDERADFLTQHVEHHDSEASLRRNLEAYLCRRAEGVGSVLRERGTTWQRTLTPVGTEDCILGAGSAVGDWNNRCSSLVGVPMRRLR